MKAPKKAFELKKKIQDFFLQIDGRIESYGLEDEMLDEGKLHFRKQAFPEVLKGVWPNCLATTLTQEWQNESRKWSLQELLSRIKTKVEAVGPYELDRLNMEEKQPGKSESNTEKPKQWKKAGGKLEQPYDKRVQGRETEWKPERSNKQFTKTKDENRGEKKRVRCYNCGREGHKKPECRLSANDPRAVNGRKDLERRAVNSLKRLRSIGTEENVDGEEEEGIGEGNGLPTDEEAEDTRKGAGSDSTSGVDSGGDSDFF